MLIKHSISDDNWCHTTHNSILFRPQIKIPANNSIKCDIAPSPVWCLSDRTVSCLHNGQSFKVHLTGKPKSPVCHPSLTFILFQCQCRNGQQCHPGLPGRTGGTPGRAQVPSQGVRRRPICPGAGWDGSYPCLCSNGLPQLPQVDGSGKHYISWSWFYPLFYPLRVLGLDLLKLKLILGCIKTV